MAIAVKAYDAKMDSKRRITLRNALYEYYHVEEFEDGRAEKAAVAKAKKAARA